MKKNILVSAGVTAVLIALVEGTKASVRALRRRSAEKAEALIAEQARAYNAMKAEMAANVPPIPKAEPPVTEAPKAPKKGKKA